MKINWFGKNNIKNGIYTAKLGYKSMMEEMHPFEPLFWTKTLWKSPAPKKAKLVLWLSLQNRLLTWDNLQKRGWIGPGRCSLCRNEAESVLHILFSCTYAKMVWNRSSTSLNPLHQSTTDSFEARLKLWWKDPGARSFSAFPSLFAYGIWWARNMVTFSEKFTPEELTAAIIVQWASGRKFVRSSHIR